MEVLQDILNSLDDGAYIQFMASIMAETLKQKVQ